MTKKTRIKRLVVLLVAGFLFLWLLVIMVGGDEAENTVAVVEPDPVYVLTAARDIIPNRAIASDDIEWTRIETAGIAPIDGYNREDHKDAEDDLLSLVTSTAIPAGSVLKRGSFRRVLGGPLALQLAPGKRAVVVLTSNASQLSAFLYPNDLVDVIRPPIDENAVVALTVAKNVRVLSINRSIIDNSRQGMHNIGSEEDEELGFIPVESEDIQSVTLELSPSQAEIIAANDVSYTLSLRNPLAEEFVIDELVPSPRRVRIISGSAVTELDCYETCSAADAANTINARIANDASSGADFVTGGIAY